MKYKLVCFDLDGTLVDNIEFSWQLFHDAFNIDRKAREEAKKNYYDGKISYLEWANHDISLWKNANKKKQDFFKAMKDKEIKLMHGAKDTIDELKKNKIKLALISGSLSIILEYVIPDYADIFDDIFLSLISFDNDDNIGVVKVTKYDLEGKALALKEIARRENLKLDECVFIGDHENDLHIAKEAGLAISFNSKSDELDKICDIVIKEKDLRKILPYILR